MGEANSAKINPRTSPETLVIVPGHTAMRPIPYMMHRMMPTDLVAAIIFVAIPGAARPNELV